MSGVPELRIDKLTPGAARAMTNEVKRDAESLWRKLVLLYEGEAHVALDYPSWGDYFETEFGGSRAYGYRLLEAGKVLDTVRQSPIGDSVPKNEAQARELAPLLDQPEQLQEAWAEVRELHPEPTAANVREVVQRRTGERAGRPSVVTALAALHRNVQDTSIEETAAWEGDWRRLAMQWASVRSYFDAVFKSRGQRLPKVLKGEVYVSDAR